MSKITHVMIDGVDCEVESCDLDYRHDPILNPEKSELAGFSVYEPGIMTWAVRIVTKIDLPVTVGAQCLLAIPVDEWIYMGEAERHEDESGKAVLRFTQKPRQVAA